MFKPLKLTFDGFQLRPIETNIPEEIVQMYDGIFEIFSDRLVLKHQPEKELKVREDALKYISQSFFGYFMKESYNHFLFEMSTNKVIGMFIIDTPKGIFEGIRSNEYLKYAAEKFPFLKNTWSIEFYLNSQYWGRKLVPICLSQLILRIFMDPDAVLSAFVKSNNLQSKNVLEKNNFFHFAKLNIDEMEHWIRIQDHHGI